MDREFIERRLAQAKAQVINSEVHIVNQRSVVASLERCNRDVSMACELLEQFEDLKASHLAEFNRLREELTKAA